MDICCLILDFDTKDPTSKYVTIGEARDKFIVLHRSGEHYNLMYKKVEEESSKGVVERKDLSEMVRKNWKIDSE